MYIRIYTYICIYGPKFPKRDPIFQQDPPQPMAAARTEAGVLGGTVVELDQRCVPRPSPVPRRKKDPDSKIGGSYFGVLLIRFRYRIYGTWYIVHGIWEGAPLNSKR